MSKSTRRIRGIEWTKNINFNVERFQHAWFIVLTLRCLKRPISLLIWFQIAKFQI